MNLAALEANTAIKLYICGLRKKCCLHLKIAFLLDIWVKNFEYVNTTSSLINVEISRNKTLIWVTIFLIFDIHIQYNIWHDTQGK